MNRLIKLLVPAAILASVSVTAQAGGLSSQLLLSSAWCSFSYNKISGTTKTTRARFYSNGTYGFGNQRESQSSGQYGSVYGQNNGGSGGRWTALRAPDCATTRLAWLMCWLIDGRSARRAVTSAWAARFVRPRRRTCI